MAKEKPLHEQGARGKLTLRMSDDLNQRTKDKAGYLGIRTLFCSSSSSWGFGAMRSVLIC